MAYLLDSSILIHAHDRHPRVVARMREHDSSVVTSALCLVELKRGLYRRAGFAAEHKLALDLLVDGIPMLDFNRVAVDAYETIIARLGFVRSRDFDRMIGAHALSVGATIVTANTTDFSDIPGLALENWAIA